MLVKLIIQILSRKQYYIAKYTTENKLYFKLKATFGHCINHLPSYALNGNSLQRTVNVFRNYSFIPNQHTNNISYDNIYSMYHGYYFDICNNLYMEHSNFNSTNVKYFLCEKDTIIQRSNERLRLKAMQSLLKILYQIQIHIYDYHTILHTKTIPNNKK